MNFSIEKMQQSRIKYIADLEKLCFSKPWSERALEEELLNENAHFFTAILYGRVIGYIGFHSAADEGYIANAAVHPNFRNMGCASLLIQEAIKEAQRLKLAFLSLEVRTSNANAIRLYEKYGFEKVGVRKAFYTEPKEDGIIMTRFFNKDVQESKGE